MATYNDIRKYIKDKYNEPIETCWIADMKEHYGLLTRQAPNRINKDKRTKPCPENKKYMLINAFEYFGMINK